MKEKEKPSLKSAHEEDAQEGGVTKTEKPKSTKNFYKKAWFWLVVVGGLALVGLGIFLAIFYSAQSRNKQSVKSGWSDMVSQSSALASLGEGITDKTTFDKYNTELQKLNASFKDKKINVSKLSFKGQDVQRYEKFLDDYGNYTNRSAELANKIADYTEADNAKLLELSKIASDSSNDVRNNVKYLTQSMPESAFKIQEVLTTANKVILAKELSVQAQQKAAEAQSAKDKADKTAVENATGNFLNAFIAGNAATMRRYMTPAYQAEYDFNQLTSDSRNVVYPASFRILAVIKNEDNRYKSQANVLYKYRDGSSQYTVGNELNFVYDTGSATWLVNSLREGPAF